jgi:uncharacterized membrane protein YcjF (UPF0283 family)
MIEHQSNLTESEAEEQLDNWDLRKKAEEDAKEKVERRKRIFWRIFLVASIVCIPLSLLGGVGAALLFYLKPWAMIASLAIGAGWASALAITAIILVCKVAATCGTNLPSEITISNSKESQQERFSNRDDSWIGQISEDPTDNDLNESSFLHELSEHQPQEKNWKQYNTNVSNRLSDSDSFIFSQTASPPKNEKKDEQKFKPKI